MIARHHKNVFKRNLRVERTAHRIEKRTERLELTPDGLLTLAADLPEGRVTGEEQQIRAQPVIPLQTPKIGDQRVGHPSSVPTMSRITGVKIGKV